MKWLGGLRISLLAFGLLTAGLIAAVLFNPQWIKIEAILVEMPSRSREDLLFQRIQKALSPQLQHYAGHFFWQVPLEQIYTMVAKDKRVREVSVYREFPNRLRVEIVPHTPVLAFLSNDNRFYPVAKDATLLPGQAASEIADLPIIRGEDLKDEPRLRAMAIELFDSIPLEGSLRKNAVSEIIYSRKDGFKIFLSGSGSEIKMGDSDFSPKVSRVEKVLAYLESQGVKGRVIDARFSKKVVVRVRNSP